MVERWLNDVIRIVDDEESVRDALSFLLSGKGWNTKAYACAEDFLAEDDIDMPGCLVLDVRMPESLSGLELQETLISLNVDLPIIFVSAHGDIEMAVRTIHNGALDFLPKPVSSEKLLAAIEKAVERSHERTHQKLSEKALLQDWSSLTHREQEVAELLAQGLPNKVVAAALQMTVRTVQVHRSTIYLKLGVHSAAEITLLLQKVKGENSRTAS